MNRGPAYAEWVAQRLTEEAGRRSSLQTRAAAVISTAGVILSLLFALERASGASLSQAESWRRWVLGIAVTVFVLASGAGLLVQFPRIGYRLNASDMRAVVEQDWTNPNGAVIDTTSKHKQVTPEQEIALHKLHDLDQWEQRLRTGFRLLVTAQTLLVLGILLVGIYAIALVVSPP